MSARRIGCERLGARWRCHTASDLCALLSLPGDDGCPIDCAATVPAELLERLEARGVRLAAGGNGVLHVNGAPMSTTERRAVRLLRPALHAALLAREPQPPAAETAATDERS